MSGELCYNSFYWRIGLAFTFLRSGTLIVILSGLGCGPSAEQVKLSEEVVELNEAILKKDRSITALKGTVTQLESEIDELKNGAPRLLAQAKAKLETDQRTDGQRILGNLVKRHPQAPESEEAKQLLAEIATDIIAEKAAEEAQKRREKRALERAQAQALKKLKKELDEFQGITWYKHKSARILGSWMQLYFGKGTAGNLTPLRLKVQYEGDSWIFADQVVFKADDRVFPAYKTKFDRSNYTSVWEMFDVPVQNREFEIIRAIVDATEAKMRFKGRSSVGDRTITFRQKTALKEVLTAYQALGGQLPN